MRIIGAIAILTLASACATTPPAAPAPPIPTVASSTATTTSTTPTVVPIALPIDLSGKTAATVEGQLRALGFTAFRYFSPDGNQTTHDPSWTVLSVDGAGSSVRPDAVIVVRVDKPVPPPAPKTAVPQPEPTVEPEAPAEPEAAAAYYKNCDAARAAGAAPLHRGDPGYRSALDRDKDGTACD